MLPPPPPPLLLLLLLLLLVSERDGVGIWSSDWTTEGRVGHSHDHHVSEP